MKNFDIDIDSNGIALITWDVPERSMNVISKSAQDELLQIIEKVSTEGAIKGAVITSGKRAFCAGADLEEISSGKGIGAASTASSTEEAFKAVSELSRIFRALETCGKPFAAAVNGTALGGGLEIVLACHYRVVADNPKIQLGLPESTIGLLPGAGGTQRLPRMIGFIKAAPLLLEGKKLDPQKALQLGVVQKVVQMNELILEAKRWVREEGDPVQPWDKRGFTIPGGGPHDPEGSQNFLVGIAMLHAKTQGNYPAMSNIMRAVYEGLLVPMDKALQIESRYFIKTKMTPEAGNMMRSLFISSQELSKGARRPKQIPQTDAKKIGVLGAGMMGAGIAYVSASVGIEVILIDTDQANAEKGKAYGAKLMDKQISRGRATEEKKKDLLALITPTTNYALLEDADLIIEAVFEDRGVKAGVTEKAEAVITQNTTFGSNTSTLPISGLAEASKCPKNFIGIHFFSPVEKMSLVEIIMGQETGDQALAVALDYVRKIKKTPIVVNDSRGFYTSRCFATYVTEGVSMLAEGISPALIENVGRATGMPVPPLAMNDEVALELSHHVQQQTKKDLGASYKESPADGIIEKMVVELGRLGKKNRKGFYDYPEDGPKRLWPGLGDLVTASKTEADPEELKKRLLYIQALETARCFEEGVLTDVRDADIGSIFGWGFAPYTGGTLSFIDTVGVSKFVEECDRLAEKYGERFTPNKLLRDMAQAGDTFYGRFDPKKQAA